MDNLSKKEIAKEIEKAIKIIARNTGNTNDLFMSGIIKELIKLDTYGLTKLRDILNGAEAKLRF